MNRPSCIGALMLAAMAVAGPACSRNKAKNDSPAAQANAVSAKPASGPAAEPPAKPAAIDSGSPSQEPESDAASDDDDDSIVAPGRYANGRFGFLVDFPPEFKPGEESGNGDGRHFTSPDGLTQETVWGGWLNVWGPTIGELCTRLSDDKKPPKVTLTYKSKGKDWCVFSGRIQDKIYYRRIFTNGEVFASFELKYPESDRSVYDAKVGKLATSVQFVTSGHP